MLPVLYLPRRVFEGTRNHALQQMVEGSKEDKMCDILVILCVFLMGNHVEGSFFLFLFGIFFGRLTLEKEVRILGV